MQIELFQPQAISEIGARTNQEDAIYPQAGQATPSQRVFVVCDGMGGLDRGEVASAAVSAELGRLADSIVQKSTPFDDNDFHHCLTSAYEALDAADVDHGGTMGTTMTFLCFHNGGCLVGHIGDSRIYHIRPLQDGGGEVRYRSRDHSLVQQLYDLGEISYNEIATSTRKNIILKAMQPHQEDRTMATLCHITDVRQGDYFYLCTDGMLEQMEDDELLRILCQPDVSDEDKRQQLVNATASNSDNHSAYLLHVKNVTYEFSDADQPEDEGEYLQRNKALRDTRKNERWNDFKTTPAVESVPEHLDLSTLDASSKTIVGQRPATSLFNKLSANGSTLMTLSVCSLAFLSGVLVGALLFMVGAF